MEKITIEHSINTEEFLDVIKSVGWKTYSKEQVQKALENIMYSVKI